MTPSEAQRQIDHASNRVGQLEGDLRQAKLRLAEMTDRVGLVVLGLNLGDVITWRGKRDTDEAGARRFAKKHGVQMPEEKKQ